MALKITDVRSVPGDSAFLLDDGTTAVLYDSGFAFTGFAVVRNIRRELGERKLDYILLTHSHYDHALGAAYAARVWPEVQIVTRRIIVATEYEKIASRWLEEKKMNSLVVRTYGATEVFPPDDADMIIDNTATGRTLVENGLRIVDTIMTSSTRMFASKEAMADPDKKKKIMELKMLFEAVLDAHDRVMLEMNVTKARFQDLVTGLPSMRSPTVAPLYGDDGYAIKIAVKKSEVPTLLPKLKELGATDILEYDLRKVLS